MRNLVTDVDVSKTTRIQAARNILVAMDYWPGRWSDETIRYGVELALLDPKIAASPPSWAGVFDIIAHMTSPAGRRRERRLALAARRAKR